MGWNLIQSIQTGTDLRLIVPFGLNLRLGDVVSVNPDSGDLNLEGTSASVLDVPVGNNIRPPGPGVNLFRQSGKDSSIQLRAAGEASTLFPELPSAKAGFDLQFDAADAWVLAMINRQIWVIEDLDRYRQAILNSYHFGVWQKSWVLITTIATVDRLTLIASSTRNTKVALTASGQFDPQAPMEVKLTSGITVSGASQELIQSITGSPSVAFCKGLKVKDSWFSDPQVVTLGKSVRGVGELESPEFWENMEKSTS